MIFGVPEGLDFVLWTAPYYRSSYVMAYRADRGFDFRSLDAPELEQLRIGVHVNTPPEESLARRGLLDNVSTYSLFFDPRGDRDRPRKLLDDLVAGTLDVAVAWGPLAGYAARLLNAPLELVPLADEPGVPLSFDISMGVAKGNEALKDRLETAIDRRRTEIRAILEEYGVPLVPAAGGPASTGRSAADAAPAAAPPPAPSKLNPFTGDADRAAEGRTLYFEVGCQGCHGGGGGGGMATSVIDDAWTFGSNDEVLFRLIKGEIPEQTMPTVYSVLEDDEVWKILAFIRSDAGDPARIDRALLRLTRHAHGSRGRATRHDIRALAHRGCAADGDSQAPPHAQGGDGRPSRATSPATGCGSSDECRPRRPGRAAAADAAPPLGALAQEHAATSSAASRHQGSVGQAGGR